MDGLTLFDGAQLAIDNTLVSPLKRDGTATTVLLWKRHEGKRRGLIQS